MPSVKPRKIIRASAEQIEAWEKAAGTATFNSWAVRALNRASAERHETVVTDLDVAEVAAKVTPPEVRGRLATAGGLCQPVDRPFRSDFKPSKK